MDSRGSWVQHASQALGHVITRSALNPLLWMAGMLMIGLVILAIAGTGVVVWAVFALMAAVVVSVLGACLYLLITNPQALQSEEYRLKHLAIQQFNDDRYRAHTDPEQQVEDATKLIVNPIGGTSTSGRSKAGDNDDE